MEKLDIYDDKGVVTGKTIIRGDKKAVLLDNEHIALSVIFIKNSKGNYLIQKTSKDKGNNYSSTGGHVNSGETPLQAIKREVLEELGIDISNDRIREFGYILYDKPIRYIFYLEKDINISDIKLQDSEVEFVKYMTEEEVLDLINTNKIVKSHGIMFKRLIDELN